MMDAAIEKQNPNERIVAEAVDWLGD